MQAGGIQQGSHHGGSPDSPDGGGRTGRSPISSRTKEIFKDYQYKDEYIESLLKNYVFFNSGLTIIFNGKRFHSRNGLVDLLNVRT